MTDKKNIKIISPALETDINILGKWGILLLFVGLPVAYFSYDIMTEGLNSLGSAYGYISARDKIENGFRGLVLGSFLANIGFFFILFGLVINKIDSGREEILKILRIQNQNCLNKDLEN